jgi:hypothetical protein
MGGIEGKGELSEPDDESLTKQFYDHPLIQGLSEGPRKPSYIPPRTFATVLLDLVHPVSGGESRTVDSVRERMEALPTAIASWRCLCDFALIQGEASGRP